MVSLYHHQEISIKNMQSLEKSREITLTDNTKMTTDIGVFADNVGYGKTLSMLELIKRDNEPYNTHKIFEHIDRDIWCNNHFSRVSKTFYQRVKATLIVVDKVIFKQWQEEINKIPQLSCYYIHNSKTLETTIDTFQTHDVVLLVADFYNKLMLDYGYVAWKRVVIDEPQQINISNMKKPTACFFWFMTSTPELVKYQKKRTKSPNFIKDVCDVWEKWNILKFITVRNEPEVLTQSFTMPSTKHFYYKCYSKIYNMIQGIENECIMNLIRNNDIKEAMRILGAKSTDNLYNFLLLKKNRQIKVLREHLLFHQANNDTPSMTSISTKIEQLENNIHTLQNRYHELINGGCSICSEQLSNPILETSCQNLFCGKCILTWMAQKQTCPLCRVDINETNLISIEEKVEEKEVRVHSVRSKEDVIMNLVSLPDKKFIIFSENDKSFDVIKKLLSENNYKFVDVKGHISEIQTNLDLYRYHDMNILLLNAKHNGSGLNLVETTDLILYSEMSHHLQEQVIGRANRIGRTKELNVHHLQL